MYMYSIKLLNTNEIEVNRVSSFIKNLSHYHQVSKDIYLVAYDYENKDDLVKELLELPVEGDSFLVELFYPNIVETRFDVETIEWIEQHRNKKPMLASTFNSRQYYEDQLKRTDSYIKQFGPDFMVKCSVALSPQNEIHFRPFKMLEENLIKIDSKETIRTTKLIDLRQSYKKCLERY